MSSAEGDNLCNVEHIVLDYETMVWIVIEGEYSGRPLNSFGGTMLIPPMDAWTLRDLEVAVTIGQQGSFSAAAKHLSLSRSSVTRSVARLEQDLGVGLFQRTTRQVRVTDVGSRFLTRAEVALRELVEAAQEAQEAEKTAIGRLRVACSATFGARFLVQRLSAFQEKHPRVELDLRFSDRRVDLLHNEIDVAIRLGELEDSSLILHKVAPEQRWLYATPDYLARHGTPRKPKDLLEHNCLFLGDDNRWRFIIGRQIKTIEVQGSLRTDLGEVLVKATMGSMGIGRLSAWAASDALENGDLVRVLPTKTVGTCGVIGALYPPGKVRPRKLTVFLSFLDEELGPVLERTLLPINIREPR